MKQNAAQWLRDARWDLFFHYLDSPASSEGISSTSSEAWNERIDRFDVPRFASQVAQSDTGYIMWTLGQNSGHFCSPNATYDAITKILPSKCSRRDLVAAIAEALAAYNIKTIAYLPSGAPQFDTQTVAALGWRVDDTDTRQAVFKRTGRILFVNGVLAGAIKSAAGGLPAVTGPNRCTSTTMRRILHRLLQRLKRAIQVASWLSTAARLRR
jgi:hypothetical protein